MDAVLKSSLSYAGSFLLIVPGNGSLQRRGKGTPFFSIDPAAASLTPVLSPAAAALNAAAGVLEKAIGRRLFPFQLEIAALPACGAGAGPCAVWEASSGRLMLDAWLAGQMAAAGGAGSAGSGAAGAVAGQKSKEAAAGIEDQEAEAAAGPEAAAADDAAVAEAEEAAEGTAEASAGEAASGDGGLGTLLGAFVETLAEQAAEASGLLKKGKVRRSCAAAMMCGAAFCTATLCWLWDWLASVRRRADPLCRTCACCRPPCLRWRPSLPGRAPPPSPCSWPPRSRSGGASPAPLSWVSRRLRTLAEAPARANHACVVPGRGAAQALPRY